MKWLIGLFLVWIVLRGRYNDYAVLVGTKSGIQDNGPLPPLERLNSLMKLFD